MSARFGTNGVSGEVEPDESDGTDDGTDGPTGGASFRCDCVEVSGRIPGWTPGGANPGGEAGSRPVAGGVKGG
jgi:hypothetical protein